MDIPIEWLGVILATVSSIVLGMIWYHEKVLGARWMKAAGLNAKDMQKNMVRPMIVSLVRAFLVAFALYHIIYVSHVFHAEESWLTSSLQVGAWVGIVFSFFSIVMHDAFENRPMILSKINATFDLASVLLAALVIGLVGAPF